MSTTHSDLIDLLVDTFRPYGWTDRSIDGYVLAIGDLPFDAVRSAVFAAIRAESKMPAPADLRRAVLEQATGGTPGVDEAWSEVRREFGTTGRTGVPQWSHPLITDTVRAIGGWGALCSSTDETGIRIQFQRTFARLTARAERDALIAPSLNLPELQQLAGHRLDQRGPASEVPD
jgi:hypothetical protein